ncbi:small heat shock chaperone IbpB [Acerihabitans arboris]|uniref:Heat shock chaperone IbpB n=1 Tax=Acerihabitans arboris TaxID=2691583 RepID=A0A845SP22_9GAMM|nr:small heat shock chaperone IbpB [Acerihabitans arboris]NDL64696.1 heat shock chaperone IbpB [Acerihabitans arboris]
MRNYDLSPLLRQWIGFDKLASTMQGNQEAFSFPPYNIEKSDDNHYRITLALAGFKQEGLMIEVEGPHLNIAGKPTPSERQVEYLHQGLVCKEFSLSFTLAEHMSVTQAEFVNGLLHIALERHVPDSLQPRRIAIGDAQPQALEHQTEAPVAGQQ